VSGDNEMPKVSRFSRALAWVVLLCTVVGGIGAVQAWLRDDWPLGTAESILGLTGIVLFWPLFGVIAVTGRPPRWWKSFDDALDIDKRLRRYQDKRRDVIAKRGRPGN
jgi:hypothetical protein